MSNELGAAIAAITIGRQPSAQPCDWGYHQDDAEAILAMPEMQAIKTTLVHLFVDEFHPREQIVGGMKAWGYSDALCDWVLS